MEIEKGDTFNIKELSERLFKVGRSLFNENFKLKSFVESPKSGSKSGNTLTSLSKILSSVFEECARCVLREQSLEQIVMGEK